MESMLHAESRDNVGLLGNKNPKKLAKVSHYCITSRRLHAVLFWAHLWEVGLPCRQTCATGDQGELGEGGLFCVPCYGSPPGMKVRSPSSFSQFPPTFRCERSSKTLCGLGWGIVVLEAGYPKLPVLLFHRDIYLNHAASPPHSTMFTCIFNPVSLTPIPITRSLRVLVAGLRR